MASGQVVLARHLGAFDYATSFSACTCVKVGEAARTPLDLKGSASVISAAATPLPRNQALDRSAEGSN